MTGTLSKSSAAERYRAFCDAMTEAGLTVDKCLVYDGNYDVKSGRNAVCSFRVQRGSFPEAIICANDNMAIGVMDQLRLYQYRVPEDILVTGFDGDDMALYYKPPITTMDAGQYFCGHQAVEMLFDNDQARKRSVETKMLLGRSCGCTTCAASSDAIQKTYTQAMQIVHQSADNIRNMIIEFAGLEQEDELIEALKKYVVSSDMESFYLCRCKDESNYNLPDEDSDKQVDIKLVNTDYTKKMKISLAYEKGCFVMHEDINRGDIVPLKARENGASKLFVVSPVFYQNYCYGYCVSVNSFFPLKSELFYSWVLNIGIGLENIRKWNLLNATVAKLNNMWMYDMLTHVYNRAGFYHFAEKLLPKLQREKREAVLLFVDIDELKKVNDNMGHNVGDRYIKEIAECLKENLEEEQILMRYGGDEFVLFGGTKGEQSIAEQVTNVQNAIEERNRNKNYSFQLGASIGSTLYQAGDISDLNDIIELADKRMYAEKRAKKAAKAEH